MKKQSRRAFIRDTAVLGAGVVAIPSIEINKKKMVIHHVFFWLKNRGSKEDLAKLLAGLQTLKRIKTVQRIHIGLPAATEDRSVVDSSFAASELLFFSELAGQKAYQDDPIHVQFIKDCGQLW